MKAILKTCLLLVMMAGCQQKKSALVFQSDFGVKDGAVSAMKGVAFGVDGSIPMYDITHEIPAYNVWEAAYRLYQSAPYWPEGTVFVSVVDPGVGTERKSIVMKSKTGHFFVTPDNGTLTLVAEHLGIESVREIDESINRRSGSNNSYTFHGRDVYAYTGARLASATISFEDIGNELPDEVVKIDYQHAGIVSDTIKGNIPVLDVQYGNIWTNINDSLLNRLQIKAGDRIAVTIFNDSNVIFHDSMPFVHTFGEVAFAKPLGYMNSLMNFSLAINQRNFADSFKIGSGPGWKVSLRKLN